jgi:uncharacterized BrkB/YihY/UPF0761 family membrane protein
MADIGDLPRAVLYAVACSACVMVGLEERRTVRRGRNGMHPTFWYVAAVTLFGIAVARMGFAERAVDAQRRAARTEGWYDGRRRVQVIALVATAFVAVMALAALARWLPNRRRYLLPAIVLCAVCGLAVVRAVSLHQVDAVIYRTQLSGFRLATVLETASLLTLVTTTCWFPFERSVARRPSAVRHSV